MMMTTRRSLAVAMSNLLSLATTWLPLAVMSSLFSLIRGEDCHWTEHWDAVIKKCASCADICDPLRGTLRQCFNECREYAGAYLTCQLSETPTYETPTTLPPCVEIQQHVTTTFIVIMVAIVVVVGVIAGLIGYWIGNRRAMAKKHDYPCGASHCPFLSQPDANKRLGHPENEERTSLYTRSTDSANGSGSDISNSDVSDQTMVKMGTL